MANVRKILSPTSSETSETQSVDDNNLVGSGNLTPPTANSNNSAKNWKRMKDAGNDSKDGDSKRPPWRAVSVSTLPKPDKNALLRAKLLDASRRLRSGKSSVAIQTDIEPTKLMKEVALSTQTDLILYKETGIMTDGSYTKRTSQGTDEFILTYAVSQMTDRMQVQEISTQTLLPKISGDDFIAAYEDTNFTMNNINKVEFTKLEEELLQQIRKIRQINTGSIERKSNATQQSKFWKPTMSSWYFEYDKELCNDFKTRVLHNVRNERYIMPFPLAMVANYNYGNLKLFFLAIDELIQESNALVNIMENLSLRAYTRDKAIWENSSSTFKYIPQEIKFPSEYWNDIIEKQEAELEAVLKNAKIPQLTQK